MSGKMSMKIAVFLVAAVLVVTTGLARAQTEKWVDQAGGSDANDGNTEATAYATLQFAIDNSSSGTAATPSIIHVKDGAYETTGQANQDGYSTALLIKDLDYLTVEAVTGHNPKVMPGTASDIVSISIENCDHLIIDNIDSDQTTAQFDNWHVFDSDDLTLRNSTFEGGEDGIDFNTDITTALIENNTFKNITTGSGDEVLDFTDGVSTDVTIQDNLFDYNYRHITLNGGDDTNFIIRRNLMDGTNSEEAIRLIGASDIVVENNVILNNLQQGIYIDTGCSNITVWHNSFFNNDQEYAGNGELRTKVTTADIIIKNNIFYANGSNPVFETSVSTLPGEDYNLVYNYSGSFTYGSNTIDGLDPLYVNTTPGSEDLHLQSLSPAIGTGVDLGVTDDKDKNPRPQPGGSNPDRGAYEQAGPLPVVLASFEAIAGQGSVTLHWITASEINCFKWEIHRAEGERGEYAKVGELAGHGSTEIEHNYQWVDRLVSSGKKYSYRLKQVDFDGSAWWSQICSATVGSALPATYVLDQNYPNPFNPVTEIRYAIPTDGHVVMKVYNIKGEEVATLVDGNRTANFYTVRWDAGDFAAGVYFCRLSTSDYAETIKMVLLK